MTINEALRPGVASSEMEAHLVEEMDLSLLDEPLEYVLADHSRQRSVCAMLTRFSETHLASRSEANRMIAFLTLDLRLHHLDEDEDLFPALSRRLLPEDGLGAVLARLGEDHRRSEEMIDTIVDMLAQHPADDPVRLSTGACQLMSAYTCAEHRHLAIENGVVLAIARIRLTRGDLRKISDGMKARRGVAC